MSVAARIAGRSMARGARRARRTGLAVSSMRRWSMYVSFRKQCSPWGTGWKVSLPLIRSRSAVARTRITDTANDEGWLSLAGVATRRRTIRRSVQSISRASSATRETDSRGIPRSRTFRRMPKRAAWSTTGTGEEGVAPVIPDEDAVPEALRPLIAQETLEPYLIAHGASIGPESSTSRLRSRSREKSSPSR